MPAFQEMAAGYRALWKSMRVTRAAECERAARRILAGRDRYLAVERITGVPWFFIGLLHLRESGCNFAGVLHNGEHILGTGRKTKLVPAGRGPFKTWEEAAIDALRLKGLHMIREWPVERIGFECERFNGWGYLGRTNSPYVWSGSNHYTRGKYIRDHVFSYDHVDKQLGTMPVLKLLTSLSGDVDKRVTRGVYTTEISTGAGSGGTVVAVGVQQGWGMAEWMIVVALVAAAFGVFMLVMRRYRQREPDPKTLPPILDNRKDEGPSDRGVAEEAAPGPSSPVNADYNRDGE